jgi:hypothetical protein
VTDEDDDDDDWLTMVDGCTGADGRDGGVEYGIEYMYGCEK